MEDREKQIAEMEKFAKDNIDYSLRDCFGDYTYDDGREVEIYYEDFATALYNAGYRKISQNEIILTKEDYERLKSDRKIRVVTKHEEDDYEICIPASEYDEMFEQERKKTAREFADKLKAIAKELTLFGEKGREYCVGCVVLTDNIDELLKQFGLEVEE